MDSHDLYKNKFNRELDRRNQLDNAINAPVLGITIVITLNSYLIEKIGFKADNHMITTQLIFLSIISITIIFSLFFLFLSYNNLFKGFNYKNFGLLQEYRNYEKELEAYNITHSSENSQTFEQNIVNKIIELADNHTHINDKRALNLYRSKTFTIFSLIITVVFLGIFAINSVIIMDEDNRPATVPTTPPQISRPEPPRMPVDRIEKGEDFFPLTK
ncbi:hypothetical protein [Flavobacterium subsaxonicum]|uniref:SMODS and SLOG-associating 2TM effector domain-containing protein n=1 Tax=Flavobacterium subsaxonicum WB 4.1-42 = DSM 21790 TaxID=1121898 RepID=A0A0A2MRB5_9FLAO|nr:hypothetical protein [Flavobacterium subsaxonicum]KGO95177.1 hypothetical protein Q766_03520 [Flavobacterium subsaxonicum WB 4.1-42 = DSM 21790]